MSLSRLRWYLARLAAMSPGEVVHRLREAGLKARYRSDTSGWAKFADAGEGPLADLGWLRQRLASAPPAPPAAPGSFTALGHAIGADDPDLWFRDPIHGGLWPSQPYCFAIDVRSTGETMGDVKYVWEINRLQMLHPLAAEVAAGRESPEALLGLIRRWADANPPYRGVNWFSGIELAMRLVSLTLAVAAMPPAALTGSERRLVRQMIAAHGFWLQRYPSRFSSANNHLVAEGLGLLLAGVLASDLPDAPGWRAEGRHILEQEAALQILGDGVGAEQSPTYQAFTMEMLAFAALMARQAGAPLAPVVEARLSAGAVFLSTLMDDAGLPPRIGDDDEGRVIGTPADREPRYVASVVAAVAGLVHDAALLPPGRDPHLRDAIFAVPAGAGRAGLGRTSEGLHSFASGGYSVVRASMAGRRAVLSLDHGPLGYLTLAAHGHADALALWLSLDDQPVFIDAGTYLYHAGRGLRNALRASPAHNTLTLAGLSFAQPSSAFSWKSRPQARLDDLLTGDAWRVAASHDGYQRSHGLRHARQISATTDGFEIEDRLLDARDAVAGDGQLHPVEICFLIHPALDVEHGPAGLAIARDGEVLLVLAAPPGFAVALVRDQPATGRGLMSPRFGEIVPATQVVLTGRLGKNGARTVVRVQPRR